MYRFDTFELDPDRRELRQAGRSILVEPKVFDLLEYLIRNKDRVVSKDELVASVWSGRSISDSALTSCINAARTVLGDSGQKQSLIKTIPRKGFRFVGDLQEALRHDVPAVLHEPETINRSVPLPDKPSIAVLPLANVGSDAEQDYFSDGITDEIITTLCRYPDLFVISRNSSFKYKNESFDIRIIGRDLGVRYLLEGSVRRAGNRVRISAQLVDAETGVQRWAERYDRDLDDIFAVQDEVSGVIVSIMTAHIQKAERNRLGEKPTEIKEAFDYYLRALHQLTTYDHDLNIEHLKLATQYLEQALALDPASAPCHSLLARACHRQFTKRSTTAVEAPEILKRAVRASETAIRLDPNFAFARLRHALSLVFKCDHDAAMAELEKALQLNPNLSDSTAIMVCASCGEMARGIELSKRIFRLDPFYTPHAGNWAGICHYFLGQYPEAEALLCETATRAPDYCGPHIFLALTYVGQDKLGLAKQHAQQILKLDPEYSLRKAFEKDFFFFKALDWKSLSDALQLAGIPE